MALRRHHDPAPGVRRVHPPVPHPCTARFWLPPHPPLRLERQHHTDRQHCSDTSFVKRKIKCKQNDSEQPNAEELPFHSIYREPNARVMRIGHMRIH